MTRLGVMGSGRGSNLQALFAAIDAGTLPAEVACVISDDATAPILERARGRGLPAYPVDCAPFRTKLEGAAERRVLDILREHQVDLVILAGFMRMVKAGMLAAYPRRIINIHPALLPAFPGLHAWKQALAAGVAETGCTVHYVDAGMDTGPVILQRRVPILPGDTPETLHARIQEAEHVAYPEAIRRAIADLARGA